MAERRNSSLNNTFGPSAQGIKWIVLKIPHVFYYLIVCLCINYLWISILFTANAKHNLILYDAILVH